ncbi:MAG: sulfite exporter TauE/SafE family protein [Phycisphaerae bacterium]|nr:sulfite exporter TauE/SafE family protein [Phycisphaerae bacterium]
MNLPDVISVLGIGFMAGLLGGIGGVGGSIVMLPLLGLLLGYPTGAEHHKYMAAAFCVNVVVAIPAAYQHWRARAVRLDLIRVLLPWTLLFLALGVLASNLFAGVVLKRLLAAFLALDSGINIWRIATYRPEPGNRPERATSGRLVTSAGISGSVAGLLGLGGGVVQVPLLQALCGVPLRQAIATSSALICVTGVVAAGLKVGTLREHGLAMGPALGLAATLAPTAVLGSMAGARLTHLLPVRWVRLIITLMLLWASLELSGLLGSGPGERGQTPDERGGPVPRAAP